MKKELTFLIYFFSLIVCAQTAFQNNGNVRIHSDGKIGFHTNLVNNGDFTNNLGFAGFYALNEIRTVSGSQRAEFFDVDIDALNNLELQTSLGITNDLSFISGKVITPRNNKNISLDFINYRLYAGEGDANHVDGYSSIISDTEFTFPIGDDDRLRVMRIPDQNSITIFKGAYYFSDPNSTQPNFSNNTFTTSEKQIFLQNISNIEFWDLDGSAETTVTLTWDNQSDITTITNDLRQLRVVGWNETEQKWIDLGQSNINGDLNQGEITSNIFIPNDYVVITLGSAANTDDLANDNIYISPNGDGKNDVLVFEGLEQYKQNNLEIFNRWGNSVYKTVNYTNNWGGISNNPNTVDVKDGLPTGTYFYILKFGNSELDKVLKGWVYITR
ncbi:hypothetical protein WH52_09855 [Tenacibaculum holothuriorum]|uniref:Gliding motility-associated C-terminal domain-containing protein n=1 Tax=Tenacibaculum holothuriorum TaxID=1635173 RepID=A0A1Y2PB80_9FLAO|nr:gliding motility-associated C-terminal domain-containing protein [Tenacibaculum holothuriorum]OSY87724.1 hypothetical protein WH52_09855 [Tenacibaculum holothuriorum]